VFIRVHPWLNRIYAFTSSSVGCTLT